jgi:Flp pilus assembly pilin Flp
MVARTLRRRRGALPAPRLRRVGRLRRRHRLDDGAAAVEFALVLPILVLILFAIIDYGLFFNASLQSRSGVHDAARAAVVAPDSAGPATCGTTIDAPADVIRLICAVLSNTNSATAKKYIDVQLPDGWQVGKSLVVCERLDVAGLTGFVPFPNGGQIKDTAVLAIEQDATASWATTADPAQVKTDPGQDYHDALPSGDWSWCGP